MSKSCIAGISLLAIAASAVGIFAGLVLADAILADDPDDGCPGRTEVPERSYVQLEMP